MQKLLNIEEIPPNFLKTEGLIYPPPPPKKKYRFLGPGKISTASYAIQTLPLSLSLSLSHTLTLSVISAQVPVCSCSCTLCFSNTCI